MPITAVVMDKKDFDVALERNPEEPQKAIVETFKAFGALDPGEKCIVLTGETLRALEAVLGRLESADELLRLVKRQSQTILKGDARGVIIALTQNQKKRVEEVAAREKVTSTDALGRVIQRGILEELGPY